LLEFTSTASRRKGPGLSSRNIQLILDLPDLRLTKPLKRNEKNLWRFKPGQTENKTL